MSAELSFKWGVEQFRLSLFSKDFSFAPQDMWSAATGGDTPEEIALPKVGPQRASGPFLDANLTVATLGTRTDIVLSPFPQEMALEEVEKVTFPTIGEFDSRLEGFRDLGRACISAIDDHQLVRIAAGAILISPTESTEATYIKLQEALKSVKVDPAGMQELLYRVNWARPSATLSGIQINRLGIWNAIKMMLHATGPGGQEYGRVEHRHCARMELDHNTALEPDSLFDKQSSDTIFTELMYLLVENAHFGECR